MDKYFENNFGYNWENVSELRSEAVFRCSCKVDGSSLLEVIGLSQGENLASKDFQCLKVFDFLARLLVEGGGGNGNERKINKVGPRFR